MKNNYILLSMTIIQCGVRINIIRKVNKKIMISKHEKQYKRFSLFKIKYEHD
jgi:hypothetical protein